MGLPMPDDAAPTHDERALFLASEQLTVLDEIEEVDRHLHHLEDRRAQLTRRLRRLLLGDAPG